MSGVAIIWHKLANSTALTAVVSKANIMAGVVPINTTLPALSITQISGSTRNTIGANEAKVLHTDRVQITVQAKTYAQKVQLIELIMGACPNTYGLVNGIQCDSILDDVVGPDIYDGTASIYFQSIDMIVKYVK